MLLLKCYPPKSHLELLLGCTSVFHHFLHVWKWTDRLIRKTFDILRYSGHTVYFNVFIWAKSSKKSMMNVMFLIEFYLPHQHSFQFWRTGIVLVCWKCHSEVWAYHKTLNQGHSKIWFSHLRQKSPPALSWCYLISKHSDVVNSKFFVTLSASQAPFLSDPDWLRFYCTFRVASHWSKVFSLKWGIISWRQPY